MYLNETLVCDHSNEIYCLNSTFMWYCLAVLFIMLYEVVLPFDSVDKTLVCDHSNESY